MKQEKPKHISAKPFLDNADKVIVIHRPKQETLEEAADNFANDCTLVSDTASHEAFIAGAKWQAERMYTYDELRQIAYNAYCKGQLDNPTEGEFNLWIQQFKKK